jgi:CRP/FNR family transcriptional regulator, cyclic AMP receptor protein
MSERQLSQILELDPELGQLLEGERLLTARRDLQVIVHTLHDGPWEASRLAGASPDHIGLLVLDGVLAREVLVSDTISTELLGPGDVVRPWRLHEGDALLQHTVRWNVLTRSRIALLDRRFAAQLARYPEVNAAVIDRINERALRLAVTQAISQLNRVDRRLLALFWHLAERWGRMTPDGVAIPMTLSHRMLGQLVGARRPTVSTALGELARLGELVRRDDGTWLLTGEPMGVPTEAVERIVPMRRHLLPVEQAAPLAPAEPVSVSGPDIQTIVARLREQCRTQVADLRAAYLTTTKLAEHTVELRDQCRTTRDGVRARRSGRSPSGT